MLFKPNFCCSCGEKIERVEWNLLTSRRFCEVCAVENRRYDLLPRASVAAGVLSLMFGIGSFFGARTAGNLPTQTLSASPAMLKVDPVGSAPPAVVTQSPVSNDDAVMPQPAAKVPRADKQVPVKVYYCGALTKKGTPCSRKVKTAGARCYQHEGQAAAAP